MKYFDISPLISSRLAVFPGDVPFSRDIAMDFSKGHHLALSAMKSTLHIGAHADSSGHYHAHGEGVEKRPIESFLGPAQVIEVELRPGSRVQLNDISHKQILQKRILFKTKSFPNPEKWNSDFMSLSPEVIEFLAKKEVLLVGIDTPSVDPETSKNLEAHQALYRTGMAVLEGIVLDQVPEGEYTLIALPLAIEGADASPVRAILVPRVVHFF